jgi:divalent metal cation (Fe/Co/Zn/Cd) transporter
MAWVGVSLVRHNLRSLMDLPLPEKEQLTITRVLARHYADYDAVGTLYTRSSGNRRFVEIELGFDDEQTVGHVQGLGRRMEAALTAELPGLDFRIVPIADAAGQDAPSAIVGGAPDGDSAPVVPPFLAP